jgi:hypothetical protein
MFQTLLASAPQAGASWLFAGEIAARKNLLHPAVSQRHRHRVDLPFIPPHLSPFRARDFLRHNQRRAIERANAVGGVADL